MSLIALMHAIGNAGIFTSRAFIPAFLTALLLRFGNDIPLIADTGVLHFVSEVPTWFTHDITLVVLGILALLEIIATKSPDVQEFLHDTEPYIKSAMAFLVTAGVLTSLDQQTLEAIAANASRSLDVTDLGLSAGVAALVWQAASLRGFVFSHLREADPHDDFGIQRLIGWAEDAWAAFGLVLILVFPFIMLAVVATIMGGLFATKRYLQYREEKSKLPCSNCGQSIYGTALECSQCHTPVAQPREIGWLGTGGAVPSPLSRESHAQELIGQKRCPVCATRFELNATRQNCNACGHALMNTPDAKDAYLQHVDARATRVLTISTALGIIPIIGMIPAIIYFRMALVRPFRQYLSFSRGFFVKWAVRVLNLVLILLQPVPGLGALLVLVMAYTNYRVYRGVYVSALESAPLLPAPARAALPARRDDNPHAVVEG